VTMPEAVLTFKHDGGVLGAQFSRDESRVLTWSADKVRLWGVAKLDEVQTFKKDGFVTGGQLRRDEPRGLTRGGELKVRRGDVTKPEAVLTFKHDSPVNGAQFSRDESRVLTWTGVSLTNKGEARLWDLSDPLKELQPAERILELEVRSGTTLDEQLNLRTLTF